MNGRNNSPFIGSYQKNNLYNNIKYSKSINFLNQEHRGSTNIYYDNNPYFLNNQVQNKGKLLYNTNKNLNKSRDFSDQSSQRSGKMTRAHGLRIVQKPKIFSGRLTQRQTSYSNSRNSDSRFYQISSKLEEQNRLLKDQNYRLKQTMTNMEQIHKKQLIQLNSKFQYLFQKTLQLENQIQVDNKEFIQNNYQNNQSTKVTSINNNYSNYFNNPTSSNLPNSKK